MQLRIFTEPQQGARYGTLLAVAQASAELGFDAFFRSDHYLAMGGRTSLRGMPPSSTGRSPAEVVDQIGRFSDIGAARLYLQILDLGDLDHLDVIASEVMTQL